MVYDKLIINFVKIGGLRLYREDLDNYVILEVLLCLIREDICLIICLCRSENEVVFFWLVLWVFLV